MRFARAAASDGHSAGNFSTSDGMWKAHFGNCNGRDRDAVASDTASMNLSAASSARWRPGDAFDKGTVIGWLGAESENGGWPPHLHFQLSRVRPKTHDMPGVVDPAQRAEMLHRYPDPRMVLGPIY